MQIHVIAATNRQPAWVDEAYKHYAKRFRGKIELITTEIRLSKRSKHSEIERARADEAERMLAAAPRNAYSVALLESGSNWSTAELAGRLAEWMRLGVQPCFFIGGPDGLGPACLEAASAQWSLSGLTLPHGLAKIIVVEALYRAWMVDEGHPYHRE